MVKAPLAASSLPPHHALLRPPAIAGHPDEGHVHTGGRHQKLSGVLAAGEQEHHFGVGLLQQGTDHRLVAPTVHGPADLGRRGDADLPGAGLLLEGVNARLAVVALGGHRGHVRPVKVAQDLRHGLGLVEVWGNGAGEVVVAGLVAELSASGGVADLGDLEQSEQVGHLNSIRKQIEQ